MLHDLLLPFAPLCVLVELLQHDLRFALPEEPPRCLIHLAIPLLLHDGGCELIPVHPEPPRSLPLPEAPVLKPKLLLLDHPDPPQLERVEADCPLYLLAEHLLAHRDGPVPSEPSLKESGLHHSLPPPPQISCYPPVRILLTEAQVHLLEVAADGGVLVLDLERLGAEAEVLTEAG